MTVKHKRKNGSHTRAPAQRKPRSRRRKRAIRRRRRRRRARTERPPQQVAVAVGDRGTASSPKSDCRSSGTGRVCERHPLTPLYLHSLTNPPPCWLEGIFLDFVLKIRRRNDVVAETSCCFGYLVEQTATRISIAGMVEPHVVWSFSSLGTDTRNGR